MSVPPTHLSVCTGRYPKEVRFPSNPNTPLTSASLTKKGIGFPIPQTEDKVGVGFVKIQHPSFVSYIF